MFYDYNLNLLVEPWNRRKYRKGPFSSTETTWPRPDLNWGTKF